MVNILSIDSTSKRLSIMISSNGKIISRASRGPDRKYMEMIISDIDHVLKKAGMSVKDIGFFGVNAGPGDFTGTRIGISIAKTLGWVLGKPVYGINSLDILAHGIAYSNQEIIDSSIGSGAGIVIAPCLDVRKKEIYYSLYVIVGSGGIDPGNNDIIAGLTIKSKAYIIKRISGRILVDAATFAGDLKEKVGNSGSGRKALTIIGGNCIEAYGRMLDILTEGNKSYFLDKKNIVPDPTSMDICLRRSINSGIVPEKVNPVYVRDFVPFGS